MSTTKRVLFIDDDAQLVDGLAHHARTLGLEPITAHNALTALNLIERMKPDLICLDVSMPTGNGLSLGEMIVANSHHVPLIILTGLADQATQQRCQSLGAHHLVKGADTWPRLRRLLENLLELDSSDQGDRVTHADSITDRVFEMLGTSTSFFDAPKQPSSTPDAGATPWVLCVEDDRDFSLALQLKLKRHGIAVIRAFEGVAGISAALTHQAEAILLDYNLPNGRGDYVLKCLKANPDTRHIPVIIISGQKRPGLEKEMLHLGATRFFSKPVRFEELVEELQRHIRVAV